MTQPWPYPRVFAHRGGGAFAPENTLAAMREGADRGFRGVEFDVKLSADGEPFLLHDDTLERTTSGNGSAASRTWAELARLDAGSWHSPRFAGEPLVRLEAVALALRARAIAANVEIKPCPGRDTETGAAVARACAALWLGAPEPPLLSSFSVEALRAARVAAPRLPLGVLFEPGEIPPDWPRLLAALDAQALHAWLEDLTPTRVEAAHRAGLRVFAYTVNTVADADRLLQMGVDSLCTDRLDLIGPGGTTPPGP